MLLYDINGPNRIPIETPNMLLIHFYSVIVGPRNLLLGFVIQQNTINYQIEIMLSPQQKRHQSLFKYVAPTINSVI